VRRSAWPSATSHAPWETDRLYDDERQAVRSRGHRHRKHLQWPRDNDAEGHNG